ncbi:hypothetical protein J5751_06985, partial [bacterium]|nr:hypothetical protein [bacterium]
LLSRWSHVRIVSGTPCFYFALNVLSKTFLFLGSKKRTQVAPTKKCLESKENVQNENATNGFLGNWFHTF